MAENDLIIGGLYTLDTSPLDVSIKEARRQLSLLRSDTKTTLSGMDDWAESVDGVTTKLESLKRELKLQATVVARYEEEVEALSNAEKRNQGAIDAKQKKLNTARQQYNRTLSAIKDYQQQLTALQNAETKSAAVTQKLASAFGNIQTVLAGAGVIALVRALGNAFSASVKDFIEYEDAFSNVRKTVDGSEADFERLNSDIERMARTMPQSAAEIAEVVAMGAQLGVGIDALSDFARVMVQLGDSTDLTAESAAEMIAQIGAITGLKASDYEKFGSALVALGNSSAATESAILAMANRIARFGTSVGLAEQDVLALSAGMASMGIQAEAGSSAMQRLFSEMQLAVETGSDALQGFSDVAGVSAEEFTQLYRTDALGALQAFLSGLNRLDSEGQSAIKTLDDLGITEVQMTATIQALSAGMDTLESSIATANSAWEEGTALSAEAEARYGNLSAQIEITQNKFNALSREIAAAYIPTVTTVVTAAGNAAEAILGMIDPIGESDTILSDAKTAFDNYRGSLQDTAGDIDKTAAAQRALNTELMIGSIRNLIDSWTALGNTMGTAQDELRGVHNRINELVSDVGTATLAGDFLAAAQDIDSSIQTLEEAESLALNILSDARGASEVQITKLRGLYRDYTGWIEYGAKWEKDYAAALEKRGENERYIAEQVRQGAIDLQFLQAMNKDYAAAIAELIPQLEAEDAAFAEASSNTAGYLSQVKTAYEDMGLSSADFAGYLESVRKGLEDQQGSIEENTLEWYSLQGRLEAVNEALKETGAAIESTGKEAEDASEAIAEAFDPSGYISRFGTEAQKAALNIAQLQAEARGLYDEMKKAEAAGADTSGYQTALNLLRNGINDAIAAYEALGKKAAPAFDLQPYVEEYGSYTDRMKAQIDSLGEKLVDLYRLRTEAIAAGDTETAESITTAITYVRADREGLKDDASNSALTWINGFQESMEANKSALGEKINEVFSPIAQQIGSYFSQAMDLVDQGIEQALQNVEQEITGLEEQYKAADSKISSELESKKEAYKALYESGEITEVQYYKNTQEAQEEAEKKKRANEAETQTKREELLRKQDQLQRAQFAAQKANSISQILIDTALAIMKAWGSSDWITATALTATIGALSATNIGLVAAQQYVPALATGGVATGPTLALVGDNPSGKELITPFEAGPIGIFADAIVHAMERRHSEGSVYNNSSIDNSRGPVTINQEIRAIPQSRREIFKATRRAIREARK